MSSTAFEIISCANDTSVAFETPFVTRRLDLNFCHLGVKTTYELYNNAHFEYLTFIYIYSSQEKVT